MKVYGPYTRKDGRMHVIVHEGETKRTVSYPKWLYEQTTGYILSADETIHHKDGDFTNNSIDNLEVKLRSDHCKLHAPKPEYLEFICPACGRSFKTLASQYRNNQLQQKKAGPYCGRSCAGKMHN